MQKALFTLLISFPLLLEAGGNFSQEKALPSYEGTFALIEDQIPPYVGYKQNDSSNVIQEIEDAFALKLKPKNLIFKIEGAIQTQENSSDFRKQKQKYTNLYLPQYVPFQILANLQENKPLELKTKECLVSLKPTQKNLALIAVSLLNKAKNNPNYNLPDRPLLIQNKILQPNPEYKEGSLTAMYLHGPEGFDFSKLNSNSENKSNLQLLVKAKEENKN